MAPAGKKPIGSPLFIWRRASRMPLTQTGPGRVVRGPGVDGDEVGTHGADAVEYHVDHDLEFRAAACNQIYERDAVEALRDGC